jgi:hypothetical protein
MLNKSSTELEKKCAFSFHFHERIHVHQCTKIQNKGTEETEQKITKNLSRNYEEMNLSTTTRELI